MTHTRGSTLGSPPACAGTPESSCAGHAAPARHNALQHCRTRHTRPSFQCATAVPRRSPLQQASALPIPAAETYTAHFTAATAVQSNEVYPTPCRTSALVHPRLGVR